MGMPAQQQTLSIERATIPDVEPLFAMLRELFGDSSLHYTVYQAPLSIHYMREMVANHSSGGFPEWVVARREGVIIGFYQALNLQEIYFLNHIAVHPRGRGLGLGSELLEHFERSGQDHGCTSLGLDVFESNFGAMEWYVRRGYVPSNEGKAASLSIPKLAREGSLALVVDPSELTSAMQEERRRGFSKVTCSCDGKKVVVGLINGAVCKVLAVDGLGMEEAVRSIATFFRGSRERLLVPPQEEIPPSWHAVEIQTVVRMTKALSPG